jgi:hypothetical protein
MCVIKNELYLDYNSFKNVYKRDGC